MRWIFFGALWVVSSAAVGAQCDIQAQKTADEYVAHMTSLASIRGCFGRQNDANPLAKQVLSELDKPAPSMRTTEEVGVVRDAAIGWMRDISVSFASVGDNPDPDWRPISAFLMSRLSEARLQIETFDATVQATSWELGDLSYFDDALDLKEPIRRSCPGDFTPSCQAALTTVAMVVRHAELAHSVLNKVLAERRLVPIHNEVSALDEKWDFYFEQGRAQYLWELGLNSWLYQKTVRANALAPPPRGQWILLHPGAAVEYVNEDKASADINVVAVVEVIGYNRLWGEGSVLSRLPLGISAIATVSLEESGDRLGWGAMIHIKSKFSIGAARRDVGNGKETTWLMSIDLAELFMKVDDETKKRFRFPE